MSESNEEKLLNEIFGNASKNYPEPENNLPENWKGYKIRWCGLCGAHVIGCNDPNCQATSCNGTGCEKCLNDFKDFDKFLKEQNMFEIYREVIRKNAF